MIGERVRHARTYHGWSQAKLAAMARVTQPAISQIEHGGSASDETIKAIADATQFAPWFFNLGPLPDLPQGTLKFRKRATSRVREDETLRAHVRQAVEVFARFERLAELPPVRVKPLGQESLLPEALENSAIEARDWLDVGPNDPIPNMTKALERAGAVLVGTVTEIKKHDGASYWPDFPYGRPAIFFTRGKSGDSQRLTLAHELGHLTLHQLRKPDVDAAEAEAFRFAGALLLPRDSALDEIVPPVTLKKLAHVKARWGISIRALVKRCLDLQLVDDSRRVSLEKQLAARGWNRSEPVEVPPEEPVLARRLIEVATGATTTKEMRHHLGLPPLAIRDMLG